METSSSLSSNMSVVTVLWPRSGHLHRPQKGNHASVILLFPLKNFVSSLENHFCGERAFDEFEFMLRPPSNAQLGRPNE